MIIMEYKFIGLSDPYTFIAEDFETATLVVLLLDTFYGATPKDGGEKVPIFAFCEDGYLDEWYKNHFNRTCDEGLKVKHKTVADALQSFILGDFKDRRRYKAALSAITDSDKKEQFVQEWQNGRDDPDNIGEKAHKLSRLLLEKKSKSNNRS